jgi:hypothetical protein
LCNLIALKALKSKRFPTTAGILLYRYTVVSCLVHCTVRIPPFPSSPLVSLPHSASILPVHKVLLDQYRIPSFGLGGPEKSGVP